MKLVDMKFTKEDKKERDKEMKECMSMGDGEYPYGLTLTLDNAQLKKLGIKTLPKVGSVINIESRATVISARESSREGRKGDRSIELQFREIGIDNDDETAEDAVKSALKDA